MEAPIKTAELADKAGISLSYASEIVNDVRVPSRALAIHIFRATGWRHPRIAHLSEEQMRMFEAEEPWTPPAQAAA